MFGVTRAVAAVALPLLPGLALAQAARSSLAVDLGDAPGPAPARIVLRAPGVRREATPDPRGTARFFHLRPGRYRLEAEGCPAQPITVEPGETTVRLRCRDSPERSGPLGDVRALPGPSDPWSALRDVPGIVLDRVDVGGSETAQASLLVSRGDGGAGATWVLDGIDVTDPASLGLPSIWADVTALESLEARTGPLDVRVRTPGVQVGLWLREPSSSPGVSGNARIRLGGWPADNRTEDARRRDSPRNVTERLLEAGLDAGGAVAGERGWIWGGAWTRRHRQHAATGHDETLGTTLASVKTRLAWAGGSTSLLALRSEKVHDDRDTTASASAEARWRQSGPTYLVALDDQRSWGRTSLSARAAWLDGGFRLEPRGGREPDPFEDFRGVFRGSYSAFETDRKRLEAGVEAARVQEWLGLRHELLLGAVYRRTPVETRSGWPGSQVLALERQSVFFRAFRLTGFALPTRELHARSVHDQAGLYFQDAMRRGRLAAGLGLRVDRLGGHSLPSAVRENPAFPDLLPAARYDGGAPGVRWRDVLPRAGAEWDLTRDGRRRLGLRYAAYAGPLGSGDASFDHPLREGASLTYYWIDRNGDHRAQPGELDALRGRVGAAGVDPESPASAVSPHAIASGLRAPRTHEAAATLEATLGTSLAGGLEVSFRRTRDVLWRPLRNVTLGDYAIRGAVRGTLRGEPYEVGYYALASPSRLAPGNGRVLTNRPAYRQEAWVASLALRGRIGRRLDWRAWGAFTDWREYLEDRTLAVQDPTPLDVEPLRDGGPVAVRPGGLRRGDVFVQARWSGGAVVRARARFGLEAALHLSARDGFPVPYVHVALTGDPVAGAKDVLISPALDAFRLPAVVLLDASLERSTRMGGGTLSVALDASNLLNRGTALQRARDVELPALDRPREVLRGRTVALGLRYAF